MKEPLVTAIIIFLNGDSYLQEAIESVRQQTYTFWELLLVDDGSTDGSTAVARQYADQYANIYYFEHPHHQNRGMSASRNLGIHQARGKYIAFLDADDLWLTDHLSWHVAILEAQPKAGMVYSNTRYWYPNKTELDFIPNLGVAADILYQPPTLLPLFISGKATVPCTNSLLVRRETALAVNGFEESFRGMYEDQAFYAKVCLTTPIFVIDSCLAWYRQHTHSNVAVTEAMGKTVAARRTYLEWLLAYLAQHQLEDENILLAVRRALWLLPSPKTSTHIAEQIRWGKKWLLRLEMLLPRMIQRRVWKVDV